MMRKYDVTTEAVVFPTTEAAQKASFLTVRAVGFRYGTPVPSGPDGADGTAGADPASGSGTDDAAPVQTHLVVDRGDSAAILIHDKARNEVVLVRQLRVATRDHSLSKGWLTELPAARIRAEAKERDEACARRAAIDETGYATKNLKHIATVHPSPGALSEVIHIFYAGEVEDKGDTERSTSAKENVEIVRLSPDALFAQLDNHELADAKLIIAAQWLRQMLPKPAPKPLPPGEDRKLFVKPAGEVKSHRPRIVGYKSGAVDEIRGIDAWVNAENTDMQMPRFFDTGVSASIRYLGATRGTDGTIYADTVADDLRRKVAGQFFVKPGAVIVTTSGGLRKWHGVKKIFHVACVQHRRGEPPYTDVPAAADGLYRALLLADEHNRFILNQILCRRQIGSILVPLIGAGNGRADPRDVAEKLVAVAVRFLKEHPDSALREIYFIAFSPTEKAVLDGAFSKRTDLEAPQTEASPVASTKPPSPPSPAGAPQASADKVDPTP